jgi:hypothetical protein
VFVEDISPKRERSSHGFAPMLRSRTTFRYGSEPRLSRPAVILAAFLALVGIAMIVYLSVVSGW